MFSQASFQLLKDEGNQKTENEVRVKEAKVQRMKWAWAHPFCCPP